jgi:hypothetical protein
MKKLWNIQQGMWCTLLYQGFMFGAGPFHLVGERGKDFGFIGMACIYLFISKGWDRCLLWIDEIPS